MIKYIVVWLFNIMFFVVIAFPAGLLSLMLMQWSTHRPVWSDPYLVPICLGLMTIGLAVALGIMYMTNKIANRLHARVEELKEQIDLQRPELWKHWTPVYDEPVQAKLTELRTAAIASTDDRFGLAYVSMMWDSIPLDPSFPQVKRDLEEQIRLLESILHTLVDADQQMFAMRLAWGQGVVRDITSGAQMGEQMAWRRLTKREQVICDYLIGSKTAAHESWTRIRESEADGRHADPKDWYNLEMHRLLSSDAMAARLFETPRDEN